MARITANVWGPDYTLEELKRHIIIAAGDKAHKILSRRVQQLK